MWREDKHKRELLEEENRRLKDDKQMLEGQIWLLEEGMVWLDGVHAKRRRQDCDEVAQELQHFKDRPIKP